MAQGGGWNQNAQYALVRSLATGTPTIDRTILAFGGTGDYSIINGHYYAAKSPGLAFASLPAYILVKAAGAAGPAADDTKQLWYLTLWGAVLPAIALLVLVYRVAEELTPGYGAAAAVTLGVSTMVLPFATLFFSHSLSTLLLFAAFAVLWKERGSEPRLALVAIAGVLAGLAATTDFVVAVPGAIVGLYALARPGILPRLASYAGGAALGALPTLAFNQWAFGAPFKFSAYGNLTAFTGSGRGHAGLYGITLPSLRVAAELLFAPIGLLTLMPVVAIGAVGVLLLYRKGYRAESLLIGALTLGNYVVIAAKQYDALGGGTPGPRYLMPMLPFLALGFAAAYRRFPVTTLALALGSAAQMVVLTLTHPIYADQTSWWHSLARGDLSSNALGFVGAPLLGLAVFVGALVWAVGLGAAVTPRPVVSLRDAATAALALAGWLLFVFRGPTVLRGHLLGNGPVAAALFAAGIVAIAAIAPTLPRACGSALGRRGRRTLSLATRSRMRS
jgi:hypothetical protein